MLQSMTGFATKTVLLTTTSGEQLSATLNLKSLNSRFFESTCRLPQSFLHLEVPIIKLLKKELRRGHVYFTISLSNANALQGTIKPALSVAHSYVSALKKIAQETGIDDKITLDHLIRFSTIFTVEENPLDNTIEQQLLSLSQELCSALTQTRSQEGDYLQEDIVSRIKRLTAVIEHIAARSHIVAEEYKKKIDIALAEMNASVEPNTMAEDRKNTLCMILDKIDIQEEITRFNGHLQSLHSHLISQEIEKGKRLDFILQELNREINTIASKCSDTIIGSSAISAKVELEKIREQAQNIL